MSLTRGLITVEATPGKEPGKEAPEIYCHASLLVGSKSTIGRLVSTFVMVSTVWSVSFCRSLTHSAPCPAIYKSGARVPIALWSRRRCTQ